MKIIISSTNKLTTMVIDEFEGLSKNELYDAVAVYLGSKNWPNISRIKVQKLKDQKSISMAVEPNQEMKDSFRDANFYWTLVSEHLPPLDPQDIGSWIRYFELCFVKKHEELAIDSYLPFVLEEATKKKEERKTLKIFTIDEGKKFRGIQGYWKSKNLDHGATLDMFSVQDVKKDLEMFLESREKYMKFGRAWKRGYLIYGPPGTGKSTLVAAMANFLKFYVYDIEWRNLKSKWELRNLLTNIERRSIVVVEDIDPTILQPDQESDKVTLLDLVTLMDGLWSSFGDEKILVFTTSHKLQLPHSFFYPGRIDFEIQLSYCSKDDFRFLADKYLGLSDHVLFGKIENLIRTTEVTPAEVVNQFLQRNETTDSLRGLIDFLQKKKNLMEIATGNPMTDQVQGQASVNSQGVQNKNEGIISGVQSAEEEYGKSKQVNNPSDSAAAQGPESKEKQGIQNENEGIPANKSAAEEAGKNDDEVSIPRNTDKGSETSKQQ